MEIKNEWMNPQQTSKEYGFSISTLAKWRMDNVNIPFSRIGKYIKYKRSDVEAFIVSSRVEVA